MRSEAEAELDRAGAEAQAALERQHGFHRRLSAEVDKLQSRAEALEAQAALLRRRHGSEVEAARRLGAKELAREREAWVAAEKRRLTKLAAEKGEELKEAATLPLRHRLRPRPTTIKHILAV